MSDTVIRVENLAKKYVLGHKQESNKTFREAITNAGQSLVSALNPRTKKEAEQSRDEFWALKDVSFEIKQGEKLGIIGHNGAGKSTLLKVISRIVEPTKGSIRIKGRVASLLEVGTGFHPELTGRENVFLNGAILGMSKAEIKRKFDEIVAFAEVEKFLDTPVKRYSSGMYVRLAFAVAAHLEPEILIIDEVLAVGDAQFQKKCLGKMEQISGEGRTVLFVSHHMGTISTLCDRVIYLSKGQVHSIGLTEKIVKLYYSEMLTNKSQDLQKLRLSGFGKKIRFLDIKLLSSQDGTLMFGQPIQYELTIWSDIDIDSLSIGSSFFSSNGNCVGALFSEEFSVRANTKLTLQLVVSNLNLAPDSYHVGFSIGFGQKEGMRTDFDIVIGKPVFEVIAMQNSEFHIANWSVSWGNIVFKDVSLRIEKLESNTSSMV
ncbi:MAG: ATP-binding cassette domain-containing protein [Cyanomargarita calcarea GSE-NOS-MK-12-04C]|uniref:ATP-binding cassette domain-containing protein n=1 Tax=Cyanomargarita calcarea GSE-NOS-MK-12-04C TaxID=2839659 RepID=A0A951UTA8_9CYAN|nr:ATP-binding cassette domain-containing protein [Cyanomargarita calcarea GSE-NOS-MK-12-04C]